MLTTAALKVMRHRCEERHENHIATGAEFPVCDMDACRESRNALAALEEALGGDVRPALSALDVKVANMSNNVGRWASNMETRLKGIEGALTSVQRNVADHERLIGDSDLSDDEAGAKGSMWDAIDAINHTLGKQANRLTIMEAAVATVIKPL